MLSAQHRILEIEAYYSDINFTMNHFIQTKYRNTQLSTLTSGKTRITLFP